MDMKKILQALDGASSKPVEGSDAMKKFLRIVREGDLNQPDDGAPADPKQQAESYIRFSSGLYDVTTLPPSITIAPGVVLPISVKPIPDGPGMDKAIKANIEAANERLPVDLQLAPDALSAIVGGADKPYAGPTLTEGANPHKVSLPVQMAMQHYQNPDRKEAVAESVFKTYMAVILDEAAEEEATRQQRIKMYSQRIAENVLKKSTQVSERVVPGQETPPGINRLTGKPLAPAPEKAEPAEPAAPVQPLSSRYDPKYQGMPEAYVLNIGGEMYKFAGREKTGPGTGTIVKVPAAAIGIRGLGAVQVELGQDGLYYMAPGQ